MSETLTVKSLAETLTADKNKNGSKSKVYKELSDEHKGEQIAQSISSKALSLKQAINAPKVDLSNTAEVQKRTFEYLEACSLSSCFPSVMGLSGALGCSRQKSQSLVAVAPRTPYNGFCKHGKRQLCRHSDKCELV